MKYALITGASSGIGLELAKLMAEKGHGLILVARRKEVLESLKAQWEKQFNISVIALGMDLSSPGQAQVLYNLCQSEGYEVEYLINNAGYGDYGFVEAKKLGLYQNMLQLNILALTELCALFVDVMKQKGSGKILNVASIAAFQPGPNFAVYAASKAYVMQFTEALNYELRGTGVTATVLNPGVTETGFVKRAKMGSAANTKSGVMDARTVAVAGYKAMMAGKLTEIPGWFNKILTLGSRTLPSRELLVKIAGNILRDTSAK